MTVAVEGLGAIANKVVSRVSSDALEPVGDLQRRVGRAHHVASRAIDRFIEREHDALPHARLSKIAAHRHDPRDGRGAARRLHRHLVARRDASADDHPRIAAKIGVGPADPLHRHGELRTFEQPVGRRRRLLRGLLARDREVELRVHDRGLHHGEDHRVGVRQDLDALGRNEVTDPHRGAHRVGDDGCGERRALPPHRVAIDEVHICIFQYDD